MPEPRNGVHLPPPQNLDAERGVIGSCLLLNEVLDELPPGLRPDDFFGDANRRMFSAVIGMWNRGVRAIDAVTLAEELERRNELAEIGGPAYIVEVLESVPHAAHAREYANIVLAKSRRRQVLYATADLLKTAYHDDGTDITDLIAETEGRLHKIIESDSLGKSSGVGDILAESLDSILAGKDTGMLTGFDDLDKLVNGIERQALVIIAARPSMGKTSFATNIAMNVAKDGEGVLFVSLEQNKLSLVERILSSEARVDGNIIKSGSIDEPTRYELMEATARLSSLNFRIDDSPGMTVAQIGMAARLQKRRHGLGLIVVDYLQLISSRDSRAPREQQVATMSRELKLLAKSLDVRILCLAQLNRDVEKRPDKRPQLSDLRESGSIEQDADQVWMLYRPEAYQLTRGKSGELYPPTEAYVIVAKNREGSCGQKQLYWDRQTTTFRNAAYHSYANIPDELSRETF